MAENKFPTEMVDLPSKGYLYPEGHPLSTGKVEIKYMTAKEEDILTSQNLINNGTVIDVLLKSLIVNKQIDLGDLIIGDKNAIMVAARILGYGKDYPFTYDGIENTINLSELKPKDIDFSKFTKGQNEFHFKLPTSERDVTFKIINGRDDNDVQSEVTAKEKINKNSSSELTTRLKKMLLSVDGKADRAFINSFVDTEFLSRDSLAFRQHVKSVTPDLDFDTTITDTSGKEIEVTIPITLRFFWPDA